MDFSHSQDRQLFCGENLQSLLMREETVSRYREIKKTTAQLVGVRIVKRASTAKAHAAIRDVIVENPTLSYQQIADMLECSRWLVYTVAVEFNVRRPRGAGTPARRQTPIQGGL